MTKVRSYFSLTVLLLVLVVALGVGSAVSAQTSVFINEIHYDNTGADVGEAIEVAGPTGTDLSGWSIVLYNGSGGAVYGTTNLSDVIPDQQGGFGTVSVLISGIQNGSPDGVALVDSTNTVVQFLSYEGSFTAADGPAAGMASTDIGVSQSGSGPVGYSLQLAGTGTVYEDFVWQPESPNTFGAVNTGQTFGDGSPSAPNLVINEIDYDQPSTDAAEFVEIKNNGAGEVDLSGVRLELINGSNDTVYESFALPAVVLAAGDYFVVCGDAANVVNCDLDVTPDTNLIQNGAPDAVALFFDGTIIDTVSYEGDTSAPYTEGSGVGLEDDGSAVHEGISRCPDGADSDQNNVDFVAAIITPGTANDCEVDLPEVNISEIRIDQPGADNDEYFEIAGAPGTSLDGLTYLVIGDGSGGSGVIENVINLSGHTIGGSGFFVAAEGTFTLGTADLTTNLNFENGDNVTHLLVGDFSGANGDDLDTDDDGVLDVTPWSEVLDLIALIVEENPPASTEFHYGPPTVGPDGSFVPGHVLFCESDWQIGDFGGGQDTPGAENACEVVIIEAKIHEVQGSGASVAITDPVLVEAVVVADYQRDDQLRGFFIQEEDVDADADPNTSEGIFVFCDGCATDVSVGDVVNVTGRPVDFFGMSQIDVTVDVGDVSVLSSSNDLPAPATIDLPADASTRAETTFEHVEGMLVTFVDELVVSEYFELARYGQLVLTADARPRQFTDANEPSVSGYAAFLEDLSSRRIILDDDNNIQNDAIEVGPDEPYFWPRPGLSITNFVRGGDSISELTGVLHWSFAGQSGTDAWRVRPVDEAFTYEFTSNSERPAQPDDVGGSLQVASFNVLNYFTTIDNGAFICGPGGDQECRGADSQSELDRQREKLIAAIEEMDAEVVGLIEIENDAGAATEDLVNGLNDVLGAGTYDYINTGFIGTDAIKQAFIYQPEEVTPVGDYAVLDSTFDPDYRDDFNRPALAQTFRDNSTGGAFTVVVNHLKSKGSPCSGIGDPDLGDGQANCNLTRTAAAEVMLDWLATDPTGSGDADFLIIGDLNSYRNEDPIDALEAGGYVDLLDTRIGPAAYTYVFDGQLGYLDHALANNNLFEQVTGVTAWNINADEIPVFDYNDGIGDSGEAFFERESTALPIYEENEFRSSDHDPVIVGLDLNGSPVCDAAAPSVPMLWPPNHEFHGIDIEGVTDPEGDPITINIDSIFQDEAVDAPDSGNTAPDGRGVGTPTAEVRAERVGIGGNGRVYHIFFTATDSFGGSCSGEVLVSVPVAINVTAIDDGALFDSKVDPADLP